MLYNSDMKALHDNIIIKIERVEEKKDEHGLILPKDKWGEKENIAIIQGTYVFDGEEVLSDGDRVIINPYAVLDTPEEDVKVIAYKDVLAIL